MSSWVNVSGFMVIGDGLPCNIGEHANDKEWVGTIIGSSTCVLLGYLINGARQNYDREFYNPILNDLRIEWRKIEDYDGNRPYDYVEEREYEWFQLSDEELEALKFPHGSEGPLDVTITPCMERDSTTWHIVIDGGLCDRTSAYFEDLKKWWKTLQKFFYVSVAFIHVDCGDKIWEDKIMKW